MRRVAATLGLLATALSAQVTEQPLAPRSQPAGATMFTELSAEKAGIKVTNNYDDPRMWGELYRELTFGAMGTGVAAGDFDNDGRVDVFVVSKTETSRLFRNLGNWRFDDVTAAAGLGGGKASSGLLGGLFGGDDGKTLKAWEQGAAFADVNNDGWLDLYVCRHGAPNRLYVNQGDGTFREEAAARGLAVVDGSGMGVFCDYDNDGWLDVYVQTNMMDYAKFPDGRRDYLFRNNGDGTFTNVTDRAGIRGATSGHSATWWDFDGDGWSDLYVANDFATPDQLYRNNGDGTFTDVINTTVPQMSHYSMGADFADVDSDGRFDLLVADMAATSHEKDQRSMAGSRIRGQKNDESSGVPPQLMHNALFLNTGTGRMLEAATLLGVRATDWTWSVRFEDFDHDGRVDLHVTNGMNREYHGADLLERIMISENPAEPVRIMQESPVLNETNLAFRNTGDLRFESVGAAWGLAHPGVSFGTATADFDGDGDLDVIYGNYQRGVSIYRNDSTKGGRLIVALRGSKSNRFGVGATVRIETADGTQIRRIQPTRGYLSTSEAVAHFGLGDATHIERLTVTWPNGRAQIFHDLPVNQRLVITEDGSADPVVAAPSSRPWFTEVSAALNAAVPAVERAIEEPNGQPLLYRRFNRPGPDVVTGDLNGDGRPDLVVGGTSGSPPRILVATANGAFSSGPAPDLAEPVGVAMGPLLLFEADGDGRPDLLVTRTGADTQVSPAAYQPQLFLNRGGFQAASAGTLPEMPLSAGAVVAADFDQDGDLDVFIGARVKPGEYPLGPASVLLRNDGGTFVKVDSPLTQTGMVTAAVAVDIDGDGWDDLVVATEWGPVRYWHNETGRGFSERALGAAASGWWSSLAVGDFNGDGRVDLAAGNLGLNTAYQASPEAPAVLLHGNFSRRRRASPTLIEAYWENGQLYPRRELQDLSREIRSLGRSYRRTADYAAATLSEILGEEAMANATRLETTEFRSGVFLSQPDGAHRFVAFPRLAQVAPITAMVAGDFDGDGHLDIAAGQNDHSPIELVGPFSGGIGQVLQGDGQGGFTAMAPHESGFVVPGPARSIVRVDMDADGETESFFITRSNASSLLFRRW
ncbi:VCBS repeat-containing protein [Synoicihabitans lomoniglobus]|uniref:VCBS repeat-containing protein n=1 Tax=Synoicihabitans lomoniglobus TaxID=2909285 RepID=A0AAF0A0D1_9BACT|nr:VCBS repeat-containing protein [Opitutaceae bacterium LMO-M01]WED64933.1 VCBS repeat-containing protein [Opitutaceae bacterium LMO-M01]